MSDLSKSNASNTVVVVGSLHYDIVVDALDRPRKGETVTGSKWYPKFGGKGGNQAMAAASMIATRFVGAVGSDHFSDFLLDHLKTRNISRQRITQLPTANTGMSVAITDAEGDYGAVIVSGSNAEIDAAHIKDEALWKDAKILILQNEIPEELNVLAAQQAKKNEVLVCLNAAPSRNLSKELSSKIDLLIVNSIEAEDMCGVVVDSLDSAQEAAISLSSEFETVVVTAGGDGVAMASQLGERLMLPAKKVKIVSTLGAGDVFVGSLCAAVASGKELKVALENANEAAAAHVSTIAKYG